MQATELQRLASMLCQAQRERRWLAPLPEELRPQTLEESYAAQDALVRMSSRTACGWKVGCTSKQTQTLLGIDQPIAGRVFRDRLYQCPAVLGDARADMPVVEAEFAFTLAADLPPRAEPYDRATVQAAVGQLHLAFEVVESRLQNWRAPKVLESVADNASHGALALSEAIESWRDRDLAAVAVTLRSGEQVIAEGRGERVLGHPLEPLVWLANFTARRGVGLRAGEVITTGTCIGAPTVALDRPVVAEYAGLGSITLQLSAPR